MMVRAEPWHWHGSEQAAESQSPEGAERVDWLGDLTATPMRCRPVVSGLPPLWVGWWPAAAASTGEVGGPVQSDPFVQAQASCFVLGASCTLGQPQVRVALSIGEEPGALPLRQQCYAGKGEGRDAEQPGVVHLVAIATNRAWR